MEKEIIKGWKDPINGLFFYDPVTTSDGQTYEREQIEKWFQTCEKEQKPITSPLTNSPITTTLTPNITVRSQVKAYLLSHPDLYEADKVYLSNGLKKEVVQAISTGKLDNIKSSLEKDPRLITTALTDSAETAFILSCKQPSLEVFRFILGKLPTQTSSAFALGSDEFFEHTKIIAQHLGSEGLGIFYEACQFEPVKFYNIIAFQAAAKNEVPLLLTVLPKITITVFELQKNRTLLHTAVLACCERLKKTSQTKPTEQDLNMIRTLFSQGANGKTEDKDKFTPAQLAYKLGFPEVAQAVEAERRRIKLAPLLAPLETTISELRKKSTLLEERDAAQSLRVQQLEQQVAALQVSQSKQLAVSLALQDLEEQKALKAFVPSVIRSFNFKDHVKIIIPVGAHHLVCAFSKKEDHHGMSSLAVIDLRKSADQSLVKMIDLDVRGSNQSRLSIAAIDNEHFIYCHEVEKDHQNKQENTTIHLWNISTLQQEKTYDIPYKKLNVVQVIPGNKVLLSGDKNYKMECFILELKTAKIQPHPHLEIPDFSSGWYDRVVAPTYFKSQLELAYIAYEKERNRSSTPKELRLYNCETFQNTVLTTNNVQEFESSSSSALFKFISPDIIAISNRSQYEKQGNVQLRLFNIRTKLFTQTFVTPELKAQGWNTPTYNGFADACLLPGDILVATCDDPESKNSNGSRLLMWDLKTSQLKFNIPLQGEAKKLVYDEQRAVLYCTNNSQIQVFQVKPTNIKSLTKLPVKSDTELSNSSFTLN